MRVSDHRYTRDLRRYNLALRLIGHEARTQTICVWTGFSDERVRKLYRSFFRGYDPQAASLRHRGPSPRRLATFLRSPAMRSEAAAAAGLCRLHGVIPDKPLANARRDLPSVPCGERLCYAFELYRAIVPGGQMTIEQLILLATIMAQGEELELGHCGQCGAAVLIDRLGAGRRVCTHCRQTGSRAGQALAAAEGTGRADGQTMGPPGGPEADPGRGFQRSLFEEGTASGGHPVSHTRNRVREL